MEEEDQYFESSEIIEEDSEGTEEAPEEVTQEVVDYGAIQKSVYLGVIQALQDDREAQALETSDLEIEANDPWVVVNTSNVLIVVVLFAILGAVVIRTLLRSFEW